MQNLESKKGGVLNVPKYGLPNPRTFINATDPWASIECKFLDNSTPFSIALVPEICEGDVKLYRIERSRRTV